MDFDQIVLRIKEHKKLRNDWEVANLLGLSKTAFAERKRRNSIPRDKLEILCEHEIINLNWLLTGEGSKYQEEKVMPGMVNEPPAAYSEETLDELVEMVCKIYKEGDFSEKAMVRGMIDEIHDKMIAKIEARLKAATEPALKKINNAG